MQGPWGVKDSIQDHVFFASAATRPWTHINLVLINVWIIGVGTTVSTGENRFWEVRDYLRARACSSKQRGWRTDLFKICPILLEWIPQESEFVMTIKYINDDERCCQPEMCLDDNTVSQFHWGIDKRYISGGLYQSCHFLYDWAWLLGGLLLIGCRHVILVIKCFEYFL